MSSTAKWLRLYEEAGALVLDTHVIYTSGKHGKTYVNKDALYPDTALVSELCEDIAQAFAKDNVETVVAPAVGGVILTQWVAHHLTRITGKKVHAVYAEKSTDSSFVIKRGYPRYIEGQNVLLVEDIVNTGGSIVKVADVVRSVKGKIVGIGALCNRGNMSAAKLNVPRLHALTEISAEAWDPQDCPLCKTGVKINTELGKGKTL